MNNFLKTVAACYYRFCCKILIGRNRDRQRPELGRITRADIKTISKDWFENYKCLIVDVDFGSTYGSRVMVRNGVLSQSFYRAMRTFGPDKEYATELCTDVIWKIYKSQVRIQRLIGRLISRAPQKQMNKIQKLFLAFPLANPGYEVKVNEIGSVASYDIFRCPVCDYFRTQGQEDFEFFRKSWCTLDWPLAEYLVKGGKYERRYTLSAGDDRCDMRWIGESVRNHTLSVSTD